jgi:riboflavin kinase
MADASPSRRTALRRGELEVLKLLASRGGRTRPVVMSSRELGEELGASQQTADNYLLHLTREGYLERSLRARRQELRLTPQADERLRREYQTLRDIFERDSRLRLRGLVISGLGEGRYYLSQPGYVRQFRERLGYTPFPGTLNVRIGREDLPAVSDLRARPGVRIEGFEAQGRSFGGARCYPARLNRSPCHLVIPDRTHYTDVLEFIAPRSLRRILRLKDQQDVDVEIGTP